MARKRHNKWKRQRGPSPDEKRISNSIEDDLRIQRLRQQERLAEKQQEDKNEQPTDDEEEDENDIGAEIPKPSKASLLLPHHLIVKGDALNWPGYTPKISSLWMHSIIQQSPGLSVRLRARLGHWAASKHLLENLQINARASTMYSKKVKWGDHALPNDMHCSWDMTCKHHLHPSARTLDVASTFDDDDSGMSSGLPAVATVLQGGWGLFQPPVMEHREPQIQTLRWYVSATCKGSKSTVV
jgi:hypothetical protein